MNINIYYGGRGLIEDPTLYILSKIETVLDELRVNVNRYNLYEMKNEITTLPQTLKEADGVIIAAHVEWHGIGGYLQEFLDACWLYGDKEKMNQLYLFPVIAATTYGENEALLDVKNAWELLGGLCGNGICTYVNDSVDFEMNKDYAKIIEKSAEDLYRTISQKRKLFPSSSYGIRKSSLRESINLTPQESEQLSKYASNDTYVKKQKEDIEELASMFKGMLGLDQSGTGDEFTKAFEDHFRPQENFTATYVLTLEDKNKNLLLQIRNRDLECRYQKDTEGDVVAKVKSDTLRNIIKGKITFQRAFMTGEMSSKGEFATLRMLDEIFAFS